MAFGVGAIGAAVSVAALAAAALHDIAVRTVPNRLAGAVAAGALALAATQHRLPAAAALAAAMFALGTLLWWRGWLGGGDVKLLAAASPLVAPGHALDLILAVAVAGGGLALVYLPGRRLFPRPAPGRPRARLARLIRCERWRLSRHGPLPYAVAIAAGAILVLVREG